MAVVIDGSGDARMREYSNLAADLEQQELEAADGVASPQVYGQLLAIYILQDDLPNAKFLWKRIPQSIKQTRSELGNIWKVGQGLWYKDFPAIYTGLAQEWPDYIRPVMLDLGEEPAPHPRSQKLYISGVNHAVCGSRCRAHKTTCPKPCCKSLFVNFS
ncbi:COP9 signalosome complex subunit 8-like isoform X2 [Ornithodoros turicata]|uniref:COP9 signalosome complex subunit 8-like isoform X2 n=1 Tax=Ornithodoros turicata TaxID=34597 RepID=UPI003138F13D